MTPAASRSTPQSSIVASKAATTSPSRATSRDEQPPTVPASHCSTGSTRTTAAAVPLAKGQPAALFRPNESDLTVIADLRYDIKHARVRAEEWASATEEEGIERPPAATYPDLRSVVKRMNKNRTEAAAPNSVVPVSTTAFLQWYDAQPRATHQLLHMVCDLRRSAAAAVVAAAEAAAVAPSAPTPTVTPDPPQLAESTKRYRAAAEAEEDEAPPRRSHAHGKTAGGAVPPAVGTPALSSAVPPTIGGAVPLTREALARLCDDEEEAILLQSPPPPATASQLPSPSGGRSAGGKGTVEIGAVGRRPTDAAKRKDAKKEAGAVKSPAGKKKKSRQTAPTTQKDAAHRRGEAADVCHVDATHGAVGCVMCGLDDGGVLRCVECKRYLHETCGGPRPDRPVPVRFCEECSQAMGITLDDKSDSSTDASDGDTDDDDVDSSLGGFVVDDDDDDSSGGKDTESSCVSDDEGEGAAAVASRSSSTATDSASTSNPTTTTHTSDDDDD